MTRGTACSHVGTFCTSLAPPFRSFDMPPCWLSGEHEQVLDALGARVADFVASAAAGAELECAFLTVRGRLAVGTAGVAAAFELLGPAGCSSSVPEPDVARGFTEDVG